MEWRHKPDMKLQFINRKWRTIKHEILTKRLLLRPLVVETFVWLPYSAVTSTNFSKTIYMKAFTFIFWVCLLSTFVYCLFISALRADGCFSSKCNEEILLNSTAWIANTGKWSEVLMTFIHCVCEHSLATFIVSDFGCTLHLIQVWKG